MAVTQKLTILSCMIFMAASSAYGAVSDFELSVMHPPTAPAHSATVLPDVLASISDDGIVEQSVELGTYLIAGWSDVFINGVKRFGHYAYRTLFRGPGPDCMWVTTSIKFNPKTGGFVYFQRYQCTVEDITYNTSRTRTIRT